MTELRDHLERALGERYRVERELGAGGMGVVFLAEDLKLGRPVAIKVLRPEIAQSVGDERFLREIRISSQLAHPNILSLIDSGSADGLLYYVMFYVRGQSLRDRLERESQLPVDDAVRIAREAADALEHAHRRGVIHRDVKPENILLEEGHALVCDFGVARALDEAGAEKLTRTGFVVGTPAYMSPEQGTGEVEVDQRADIYALGCLLYEMLVGAPPFAGALPHVILAMKSVQPVPPLRRIRETVPEHVERAVLKALARTPADRFESAAGFAAALADPGYGGRGRSRFRGRWAVPRAVGRPALIGAAGLVGALAVGGAAVYLWAPADPGPLQVRAVQITAMPGLEDSPSISPDARWIVYAGDDGDHRDIFLRSLVGERAINLTEDSPANDYSPAFSSDGTQIVFRSDRDDGGLFVMGPTGEAVRKVSDRGETPAWSPDGRSLVYSLEHIGVSPLNMEPERPGLWRLDLETNEHRELVAGDAVRPAWSPNGRWIAYTSRSERTRTSIWVVPTDGGRSARLTDDRGNDWGAAWSPDGRHLYFSSDRGGSMNLWRVALSADQGRAAGNPESVPTPSSFAAHPTVSSDGTRILFSSVITTQNIERAALDPEAGTLLQPFLLTTGTRKWSSPDPTPDGSMIAFYTRDLPEGDLYVVNRDGTGLRQLTGDSAIDRVPRWSPDGTRLAYFSNRGGVVAGWVIRADGSGNEQLTHLESLSAPGAWSPDGRWLAVNVPDGVPFLLDLARGWTEQTPRPLVVDTAWGPFVTNDWSPDGTRLAGMHGWSDRGVGYYDLATDRHVPLTDFGQWPVWLPDGQRLLFVTGGREFHVVDSRTGEVRRVHATRRDVLGPPRITADGREAVYSRRVTEGDIWLVSLENATR
jgi:eukaryotic-like serine/threonine-protein kinase